MNFSFRRFNDLGTIRLLSVSAGLLLLATAIAPTFAAKALAAPAYVGGTHVIALDECCTVAGVGDVDGDGRDDILFFGRDQHFNAALFLSRAPGVPNGADAEINGERQSRIHLLRSAQLSSVLVADFDGDGVDDIILSYFDSAVSRRTDRHHVHVIPGRAAWPAELSSHEGLRFTRDVERPRAGRSIGTERISLAVADVNGDQRPDLVLGVDMPRSRSSNIEIFFGRNDTSATEALAPDVVIKGLGRCQDALGDIGDLTGDGRTDLLVRRCAGQGLPDLPLVIEGRDAWPSTMMIPSPVPEEPPDVPLVPPPPSVGGYVPATSAVPPSLLAPRPLLLARDLDGDGVSEVLFEFAGRTFAWRGGADIAARVSAGTPDRAFTGVDLRAISVSRAWHAADLNGDGAPDLALGALVPSRNIVDQERAMPHSARVEQIGRQAQSPAQPGVALFTLRTTGHVIDGTNPDAALLGKGLTLWGVGDFNGDGHSDLLVGAPPAGLFASAARAPFEVHLGPIVELESMMGP